MKSSFREVSAPALGASPVLLLDARGGSRWAFTGSSGQGAGSDTSSAWAQAEASHSRASTKPVL